VITTSRLVLACLLLVWFAPGLAKPTGHDALLARHAGLAERLRQNQFQRPLYLDSSETSNRLVGDIYAVVDYPFSAVSSALRSPKTWCEVLILHINTKYCHAAIGADQSVLSVSIGKKSAQPIEDAYAIQFAYRLDAVASDYLAVSLAAGKGPLSTRDYLIRLEAIPLKDGRSFIHLGYAYSYGWVGRLAMKTYLATVASDKVGFTIVGRLGNGQPEYVGGMRGVAERNTMRYYLAIDAYLGSLATPAPLQLKQRLNSWFAGTERYARQLHEISRTDYLDMKTAELDRQRNAR
jgi:hypothetical protein